MSFFFCWRNILCWIRIYRSSSIFETEYFFPPTVFETMLINMMYNTNGRWGLRWLGDCYYRFYCDVFTQSKQFQRQNMQKLFFLRWPKIFAQFGRRTDKVGVRFFCWLLGTLFFLTYDRCWRPISSRHSIISMNMTRLVQIMLDIWRADSVPNYYLFQMIWDIVILQDIG